MTGFFVYIGKNNQMYLIFGYIYIKIIIYEQRTIR